MRQAELELEEADLEFQERAIGLIDDIADNYYELFEVTYQRVIYGEHVSNLERAAALVEGMILADSSRTIDASQIRVELANARERLEQVRSEFRVSAPQMKQQLRLAETDSLVVRPVLDILPIDVDLETAIEYGMTLRPSLRELEIECAAVGLGRAQGAYRAATISVRQTELALEETRAGIRTDITSAVQNLEAYRQRTSAMAENLEVAVQLTETSLSRYADDEVTTLELLRSLDRQAETAANVLDTYLGYRRALLDLQELTYYDFEHGTPVLDRFRVEAAPPQ